MNDRDSTEFREFVTARGPSLLRMARALTGAEHSAEDLLQTALEKTYPRWGRLDNPEAYVRRAIYNEHTTWWRRALRRPERLVPVPPEVAAPDGSAAGELRTTLAQAIGQLPPRQRAVVVLRYLDDWTERDVADLLGCSTSTVGSQLSRALAKLRESYPAAAASDDMREARSR